MGSLAITWTLHSHGWAYVKVADDQGQAEVIASYVTDGPEQFLYAVARLMLGDEDTRASIRLVRADDGRMPDTSGTLLWSGLHTVTALARSTVRAFDRIVHELGEESYEDQWGRPFPRAELEALRIAMRTHLGKPERPGAPG